MSCCQNISTDEYITELLRRPSADSYPLVATLDITERCNFTCIHCFLGGRRIAGYGDISVELGVQVLDALAAHGVLVLVITGGEPLLHPKFRELWLLAKKRGFLVTLFTNASEVDAELALFLVTNPPRKIEISVYGCTERTYEDITCVPGSFRKFIQGIGVLEQAGLNISLKFPVMRKNWHELELAKKWSADIGLRLRFDAMISPTIDGGLEPLNQRVSAEIISTMESRLSIDNHEPSATHEGNDNLFQCGAGIRSIHIDAAGKIHPCVLWRDEGAPLLETNPIKWNGRMDDLRKKKLPTASLCRKCNMRLECPSCPALSRLETGEAGAAVKYYCDLAGIEV